MKALYTLTLAALMGISTTTAARQQKYEKSFVKLQKEFVNPSKEFRSAPLWVWNTQVTEKDIDRMLAEFKEQGFGGAFIHPRPGLETEYLSEEWFRLWKYSLQKGKQLGLDIWIYDENSYPSGFAGGHVPDQMPESYNQGQTLLGQRTHTAPQQGNCYMCLLRQGDSFENITDKLNNYQGKSGDYYVYQLGFNAPSTWTAGYPYVDLMVKGVTEKFIEITMQKGYERYLGKELGTSVKGTFTDEPEISCPSANDCRWTPDLFDYFEQMWGYDLRPNWPLLGEEIGNWQKVRHDYNATLLQLFIDRWCKPWYNYTEKKGLLWTGHYWEHNWPDLSLGPDNMAMYAWHQMPAIDMLFNQYDDNANAQAQFGNIRSVKELRSVANQKGYVRTLSETYGGGGWDESLQDLKRLGDWEYALGVNFMNQHLSHITITGARKYDYPPVFTPLSPWWSDYGELNTYFARLSLLLSQGEQQNDWLILEPTTSLWLHFTQVCRGDAIWQIAKPFQQLVTDIEKQQMEYDLGSENIIKDCGSVTKDGFRIDKRTYRTVVLPPMMQNLESPTFKLLQQFAQQGGCIIAMSAPTKVDGNESAELKEFMNSNLVKRIATTQQLLDLYNSESTLKFTQMKGNHVFHHRRVYNEGELLFLVNSSKDECSTLSFEIPGKYLYKLDAMTGAIYACNATANAGKVSESATLMPAGSALYMATDKPLTSTSAYTLRPSGEVLQPIKGMEIKPVRHNVLNLDFCNLTVEGKTEHHIFTKQANDSMWKQYGGSDPWETAVQFRRNIIERDTFTTGNITIEYPFFVTDKFDYTDMHMIVEKPWLWRVSVNGKVVEAYTEDQLLDHRCGDYSIGNLVKQGVNIITLHRDTMSIYAEIAPVMLLGNFSVNNALYGFSVGKATNIGVGNYVVQGYPEYPWEMAYSKTYNISHEQEPHYLKLNQWSGTVAQVWINGEKVGSIAYAPYELDVTGKLKHGENKVEVRVVGSLANLYGPHYGNKEGWMGPWMWNGVMQQRPGEAYNLYPYGLEGFDLY